MDVRCEKCGTEYELDEARLKPTGVTVKCTNCGHMFKIRKRTTLAAGVPVVAPAVSSASMAAQRSKPVSAPPAADDPTKQTHIGGVDDGPTSVDRQWLIRLENGDQKSCRELATLQQWIVAGVVTRESLISRTGKTWKRLGDVAELAQYFDIGDETRTTKDDRASRTTGRPPNRQDPNNATLLGMGAVEAPDDEDDKRRTGNFAAVPEPSAGRAGTGGNRPVTARPPTPPPPAPNKTLAQVGPAPRRPATQPPPPPAVKRPTGSGAEPLPRPPSVPAAAKAPSGPVAPVRPTPPPPIPTRPAAPPVPDGRSTASWASDAVRPEMEDTGPSGPIGGKVKIGTEPAFAGRVRVAPSDGEAAFRSGRIGPAATDLEDDDDVLPPRRGSRGGLWLALATLVIGGAAAAGVYLFVFKKDNKAVTPPVAALTADAAVGSGSDAGLSVTSLVDAGETAAPNTPLEAARSELAIDSEARLRTALTSLAPQDAPDALAMRAILGAQLAQDLADRAKIVSDKSAAADATKEARQLGIDAASLAQRSYKASPDDVAANLAMASALRVQGKSAKDITRYADTAASAAKGTPWARDVALAAALVLQRDGKLDDAKAAFSAIDSNDGKLEVSNDVRARYHLALVAVAQTKTDDAKSAVASILAVQPDHEGAKALDLKLATAVATSDPMPTEDGSNTPPPERTPDAGVAAIKPDAGTTGGTHVVTPVKGDSYDSLVKKANDLAEHNCTAAMPVFEAALEQKPNGVEALTGKGYCHLDAKQFASAQSSFRAALSTSPHFEPALWGVAEAYQQQGRKDDAITAYRKYLDSYPGSAKAQKQLERLGAADGPAESGSSTPPVETPPPDPTPTPTPTPPVDENGQPQKPSE